MILYIHVESLESPLKFPRLLNMLTNISWVTSEEKESRVNEIKEKEKKAAGKYEAYWGGKNDNGQTVTEGIYFVYIQIGTRVIKKNIIVTK